MKDSQIFYVPWLHMHQPLVWTEISGSERLVSNLLLMLSSNEPRDAWDAKLISRAYKNPAKYVKQLKIEGRNPKIMIDFSGILLESLVELSSATFGRMDIDGEIVGDIIGFYREVLDNFPHSIEIAGSAYSHCYFPSTPEEDWQLQIEEWKTTFKKIFGGKALENVRGFWLPELGLPGYEDKLYRLIKVLIDSGYEWLILPLQAIEGYESLSYEKRIQIACQPNLLRIRNLEFPVIFRFPDYVIDQQAGCEAGELVRKAGQAGKIFSKISKKPALVVPASDGENGNVMMNEFFPKTFVPFFEKFSGKEISSLSISEFLDEYYTKNGKIKIDNEVKIKTIGASWVGGHKSWIEGAKRADAIKEIEKLSKMFHGLEERIVKKRDLHSLFEEVKRALLIAETSCYVYWGTDFWFDQGKKTRDFANKKFEEVKKYL